MLSCPDNNLRVVLAVVGATLAGFLVPAEEDTTAAADEMSAKVGSAANSMHGYFKGLSVGYALDQVGGALLDGVESAASDAAVNPERIAQFTQQINQQKAAIAQHQAELDKWMGTTAQVDVSHCRRYIASETTRLPSWSDRCNPYGCQQAAGKNATDTLLPRSWFHPKIDCGSCVTMAAERALNAWSGDSLRRCGVGTVTDGVHERAGRSKLHDVDARVRQSTSMPAPSGTIVISVSAVVTTALNPCTGPSTGASRRR